MRPPRNTRRRLAEEHGVPPYVIFHDATLMEMVYFRPQSAQALLAISGVGQSKLDRFSEAFLETLAEFNAPAQDSSDTLAETLLLLRAQMTSAQIARQRSLSETTVYNHMAELIQSGQIALQDALDIAPTDLARMQDEILAYDGGGAGFRFKQVFDALDGQYSYGILRCVRAALLAD